MAYTLIEERMVGTGMVGEIEKIYRCDNGYGALVGEEPPGLEGTGRLAVTPVHFQNESASSYRVLSSAHPVEGLEAGDPVDPRFLDGEDDLVTLLERLDALPAAE